LPPFGQRSYGAAASVGGKIERFACFEALYKGVAQEAMFIVYYGVKSR
jgi:hypothetical protein